MKIRRFLEAGIEATRKTLLEIERTGNLALAEALVSNVQLTEPVSELQEIDLDPDKVFSTAYDFCEYFHSLMQGHTPEAYHADIGFWTWLAMVYLKQLGKPTKDKIWTAGEEPKIVYMPQKFQRQYRHMLAGPFYVYEAYQDNLQVCKAVLWHDMNVLPELSEQILGRYDFSRNPAYMAVANKLYFDEVHNVVKTGAGSKGPGTPRNLRRTIDQLAMTRDFFTYEDADELLELLPAQFDKFAKSV